VTTFETGQALTFATANAVLKAGLNHIAGGATAVDCARLQQFDSSALAVLLAWQREARARRAASFSILNLPDGLASLAQAYGVQALVSSGRH
jgi:phospholipid transport system transporter-binding protein